MLENDVYTDGASKLVDSLELLWLKWFASPQEVGWDSAGLLISEVPFLFDSDFGDSKSGDERR